MPTTFSQHLIYAQTSVRNALIQLDKLASDAILFVVDEEQRLIASLTDGDLRRGFIKGLDFDTPLMEFVQANPRYILEDEVNVERLIEYRKSNFRIIPVLDAESRVVEVINFKNQQSLLPLEAVIMAGGEGQRLRPATLTTPKPLLKVGGKPIIEYNIDRLQRYGVKNMYISIRYLGQQLVDYFGDGTERNLQIDYLHETQPLGTIGALSQVKNRVETEYLLVMNSDLLTTIDFEDLYRTAADANADLAVATIPYQVQIPYAILETREENQVTELEEKPTYTYYANAGIYLIKTSLLALIPEGKKHDATDLMNELIRMGKNVISFPILGYWLDIGKPEDFEKAQQDIKHLEF